MTVRRNTETKRVFPMVNFEDENFFFETFIEALNEALSYVKGEPNSCTENTRISVS